MTTLHPGQPHPSEYRTRAHGRMNIWQTVVHLEPGMPITGHSNVDNSFGPPFLAAVSIGDDLRNVRLVAEDAMLLRELADAALKASQELEAAQFEAEQKERGE